MRWPIESMFHQLKIAWGLKEAWQQTRKTLIRWAHITMIGYGLMQLLSLVSSTDIDELCRHSPWRKSNIRTAGLIRKGLTFIFRHVNVRDWWDKRLQKFEPPNWLGEVYIEENALKVRSLDISI